MYMHTKRSHTVRMLKILSSMSEFGGLLKHQKNPACTKSVTGLQNAEFGHYTEEEEEMPHICALTDRNAIVGNCCC